MKKLLLSLLISVGASFTATAETSTLTLKSGDITSDNLTTTKDLTLTTEKGFKWTFSISVPDGGSGKVESFDNTKGAHFGSNNQIISELAISSDGFSPYTITKVTVNASGNSKVAADMGVSVNGVDYTCDNKSTYILTAEATDAVFEGAESGEISIKINCTAKAFYVNSIQVEYTSESVQKQAHLSFPKNDYYVSVAKAASFEAPELDNPYGVSPITFSVDNEELALIDENTGEIALESAVGDVTVTASFPGNDEYEADEQTYVIHITENEFVTVMFDFEQNDYGMERVNGSNAPYNPAGTKFGDEWVICTANERTRLWWTGKEATEVASGKSLRVYSGGKVEIETPAGTEITNIGIFHYNESGDATDVSENEDHEHVASIEGNKAVLAITSDDVDSKNNHHKLSAVEITYMGATETLEGVVNAFKAGQHDNGDSHFTVKVNGVEQVSHSISFASGDTEPTKVELSHYYPHATIFAKFEPAPQAANVYYDSAEGFAEHSAPITLTGSGTLSYYAELNGHSTPVQTVSVTDTTTSISEINSASKAAEVYDLQGRRVLAPARGLYIIGGKLQLTK